MKYWLLGLLTTILVFNCKMVMASNADSIVVVTEEWPPYNYRAPDGTIIGIATDKVRKVLEEAKVDYSIDIYPWTRAYKLATEKPNTAIYSIVKTSERTPLFHWFCPVVEVKYFIFRLKNNQSVKINSFDEIKKYTLGLSRGTFFYQLLKKEGYNEGEHFHATSSTLANVRELLHKRVEIIADTKENIAVQLKMLNVAADALEAIYQLKHASIGENCLALSLGTPQKIIDRISASFKKVNSK